MTDPDALAEALLELTTALTIELHPAIAELAMPGHFEPAGPAAAAVFQQPPEGEPTHRSGAASEPVAALAEQAAAEPPSGWPTVVATATRSCRHSRCGLLPGGGPPQPARSGWRRWPAAECVHSR